MKFIFQGCQKKHVRVAISQNECLGILRYAPQIEGFWIPDWLQLSQFMGQKFDLYRTVTNTSYGKLELKYPEKCAEVLCTCPLWYLIPAQYWQEWEIWGNTTFTLLLILSLSWLCRKLILKWGKNEIVGNIFHKILQITTLTL